MSDRGAGHDDLFEQVHRHVTARIAGEMTPDDFAALDALLDGSAAARHLYVQYVYETLALTSLLGVPGSNSAADADGSTGILPVDSPRHFTGETPVPPRLEDAGESETREQESELPAVEPVFPPIIIQTSPAVPVPAFSLSSSLGGWLFSYAVAMVLTGVAILGAWVYTVSLDSGGQVASLPDGQRSEVRDQTADGRNPKSEIPNPKSHQPELVGRITGVADCRGGGGQAAPPAAVPLGRKYELASGLMEISYDSGAKVILEGPCVYEIDSPAGGFLSLGKLTARVASGQWPVASAEGSGVGGQGSEHYPLSTSHCPLFSVRTPTAVITDLGTEFGVEVEKSGATRSHVFRGKVELKLRNPGPGQPKEIVLRQNEGARVVDWGGSAGAALSGTDEQSGSTTFARRMPEWVAIKLYSTGVGLKEGDPDPHWQIVARSDEPHFQPRPAVVVSVDKQWSFRNNDPTHSQWISTAADMPDLPNGVTYTFRTTFELIDALPESALLRGGFIADNRVVAIRLNGRQVAVPEHGGEGPFNQFNLFSVKKGFAPGANVLEVDVYNGSATDIAENRSAGPMSCRVELEGFVRAWKTTETSNQVHRERRGREVMSDER